MKRDSREAKILKSARDLFWKHGFRRVPVEEICEKAGISKMTFYRYFPNKIELAKKVFDNVANEGYMKFKSVMNEKVPPHEKIHKILLLKFEGTNDISQEFLMDFYSGREEDLRDYVQEKTKEMWRAVIADLKVAQEEGILRKDLDLEFFFLVSGKFTELFGDDQIQKLFATPREMIYEFAKLLMYGITPDEAKE